MLSASEDVSNNNNPFLEKQRSRNVNSMGMTTSIAKQSASVVPDKVSFPVLGSQDYTIASNPQEIRIFEKEDYKSIVGVLLDSKVGSFIPTAIRNQLEHIRVVADKLYELRCKCVVAPSKIVSMDSTYLNAQDPSIRAVMLFQYYATNYVVEHPAFRKSLFHAYYLLKKLSSNWLVPHLVKRACDSCKEEIEAIVNTATRQQCLDIKISVCLTESIDHVTKSVSDITLRCPSPPSEDISATQEHSSENAYSRQWQDSF